MRMRTIIVPESKLSLRIVAIRRVDFHISEFAVSELIRLSESNSFSREGLFQ